MSSGNKVTIRGKVYDLDDIGDVIAVQSALVPENWPIKKADCVKVFISLQNMLAFEFKRHLAANWKAICKAIQEEANEPGGVARLAVAFNFEVDQTAPTVAAFSKSKMSFSVKHSTEGKPRTHDINQGEFLGDDLSVVLDVKGFAREAAEPEPKAEEKKGDEKVAAFPGSSEAPAQEPPAETKTGRKRATAGKE